MKITIIVFQSNQNSVSGEIQSEFSIMNCQNLNKLLLYQGYSKQLACLNDAFI